MSIIKSAQPAQSQSPPPSPYTKLDRYQDILCCNMKPKLTSKTMTKTSKQASIRRCSLRARSHTVSNRIRSIECAPPMTFLNQERTENHLSRPARSSCAIAIVLARLARKMCRKQSCHVLYAFEYEKVESQGISRAVCWSMLCVMSTWS